MKVKIKRNLIGSENKEFWSHVISCYVTIKTWPEWKRAGISKFLTKQHESDNG